jgi:nitrate reductase NapAB chaperone NapD
MLNVLRNLLLLSVTTNNSSESSLKYLSYITKMYFVNQTVLVVYWTNTFDLGEKYVQFLVEFDFVTLEFCNVDRVVDFDKTKRSNVENIVILLDDLILDENQIRTIRNCESWNSESKIVVLVQNQNEETIKDFLKEFWGLTKAINVTIMSTIGKFYTLQPYKNLIMEELNIDNLFFNKIPKNFNGSVIYAVTNSIEPYVFPPNDKNIVDGFEIRIINEISKHLNFHVEYKKFPPGENAWQAIRINGRVTGSIGFLDRFEVDIAFHALSVKLDTVLIADYIAVHTVDEIYWLAPKYPFVFTWKSLFIVSQRNKYNSSRSLP